LTLAPVAENAIAEAYPDLVPADTGGMKTGYLGRIMETRGHFFEHAVFGWGAVHPYPGGAWHWFPSEGWLAASPDWGPYLFSTTQNHWLMTLVNDWETDWLYDYRDGRWRRFGEQ
jgi:hypothetical protein